MDLPHLWEVGTLLVNVGGAYREETDGGILSASEEARLARTDGDGPYAPLMSLKDTRCSHRGRFIDIVAAFDGRR